MSVFTGRDDHHTFSGGSRNDSEDGDLVGAMAARDRASPRTTMATAATVGAVEGVGGFPLGLGGAMELLNEELQQEIAPRKLLRQFSLNIPPYGASTSAGIGSGGSSGGAGSGSRGAASPHGFADSAARLDRHMLRRNTRGSIESLAELDSSVDGDAIAAAAPSTPVSGVNQASEIFETSAGGGTAAGPSHAASGSRNGAFEAKFGDGFLGLEFVINDTRRQVMVKSVQDGAWTKTILQIPPWATITRGLIVDSVNGRDVATLMPEEVIDMLQFTLRPLSVRFRRCEEFMVVCKLCECRIDAWSLDEHTNYCVMSRRFELEADQINNALARLATSIQANLESEALRVHFHHEELHFYNALRVIAIQASSCDVSQIESFALCSRLIKILDRIRTQEPTNSSNFVVERGLKYCCRIRNLTHAKMSKMRQTQKVLLQQLPPNDGRATFQRTKSLEDVEKVGSQATADPLSSIRRPSACRVSIRDFQIVKPISKGAFGKVYLARKKTTGDQYAIKVLAKEHVLRKKQIEHIETERDILVSVESPFVVRLFWTFQTRRNLFLVMEYLPGGDFMSLLECIVQLEEQVARIYIAEVALALNHLHMKGCVHRDLKPDNILISSSGHIKLTDFGLSEEGVSMSDSESVSPDGEGMFDGQQQAPANNEMHQIQSPEDIDFEDDFNVDMINSTRPKRYTKKGRAYSHTHGRCGTPDYLSPEIILNVPHGPPVDFWALGVILYEMLVGFPPFNDETVEAIFNNILERQILWPDGEKCLSDDAIDLINKLLEPDQSKRLGWEGVKNHPFFRGIDWDTLLESTPPFVPTLEGPNDTSYFNNRNLTDIFIDDEEFDFDAQSVDSNMVDQQTKSGGQEDSTRISAAGKPSSTESDEHLMNAIGALLAGTPDSNVPTDDNKPATTDGSFKSDQEPSITVSDTCSQHVSIAEDQQSRGENILKFPSGMYNGPRDESAMNEAFRTFSFTNMNALAAASRNEAEIIADTHLSEVENSSSVSILI